MVDTSEATQARRGAILDAAIRVFSRYGYKKTSMDDLARAAGLSRQGLYLHFATKEALFEQAVRHAVDAMRTGSRAALARDKTPIEARLLGAFEALQVHGVGHAEAASMNELLEAAAQIVGPVVDELEQEIISEVARALRTSGVAARWKATGVSAKDLAENLYATSLGFKHRVRDANDYRERMRIAIQVACSGAA